jgi:DNA-binding beta-propeller fold protein YncE
MSTRLRLDQHLKLAVVALAMSLTPARAADAPAPRISVPSPGAVSIVLGLSAGPGAVSLQRDGSLVVAATTVSDNPRRANLFRFGLTSNGQLANHATAQMGDVVPHNLADVTITSKGEIIVVGDAYALGVTNSQYGGGALAFMVARFSAEGRLDTSFGGSGWILTDLGRRKNHNIAHGVAVEPDGKILVTGNSLCPIGSS